MGLRMDPTCDVCGTQKEYRTGIGSFCPNDQCGGVATPQTLVDDTPPQDGKFARLSAESVTVILEEQLRSKPMLDKIDVVGVFAGLSDGTSRRVNHLLVEIKHPDVDRRPGAKRTAFSKMHPKGITIQLATREGVDIR